jgi:hypothetical protein
MILPNKDGTMMRVPRELRKYFSFKKKYNELMQGYVNADMGNYIMLDQEQDDVSENQEENSFKGYWIISFDGACSSSRNGVGVVFKSPNKILHPHAIRLEFPCTNNGG